MDWQPEHEFVIPQQNNAIYTYGEGAVKWGASGCDRDEMRECSPGYFLTGKKERRVMLEFHTIQAVLQQNPSGMA
jgi:hypothetical protein